MKKAMLFVSLLSLAMFSINVQAKEISKPLDQIVAVVNDDVVTTSELNRSMYIIKMQMSQQHLPVPSEKALRKQVLDQLVDKKLQLQVAKQIGINVSSEDLDKAVANVAEINHMSVSDLYRRIGNEGMSPADYRNEMRDQIVMQKLQQQEVINHINITKEEVGAFMRSKAWQNNSANEYHLEDILIPLPDSPSTAEITSARKHAEAVIAKLNKGQSFQAVAEAESGESNALKGGDLGWRKLPEIPSAFSDMVVHMRAKEVAGPVQTSNGFHIIRLAGVRAVAGQDTPDSKQIENQLLQQKFEEALQTWVSKLRSQAFINTNPVS